VCNPFSETGHLALLRPLASVSGLALLLPTASVRTDDALTDAAKAIVSGGIISRDGANLALTVAAAALATRLTSDALALLSAATEWFSGHVPAEEYAVLSCQLQYSLALVHMACGAVAPAMALLEPVLAALPQHKQFSHRVHLQVCTHSSRTPHAVCCCKQW
jgi:hypothetical protein